jgi:hypothetical protein
VSKSASPQVRAGGHAHCHRQPGTGTAVFHDQIPQVPELKRDSAIAAIATNAPSS